MKDGVTNETDRAGKASKMVETKQSAQCMIRAGDFQLQSFRLVAFTADRNPNVAAVLGRILPEFAVRYNGELTTGIVSRKPAVLQIQIGGPLISLSSADERWQFRVWPDRVESLWTRPASDPSQMPIESACQECLLPLIRYPFALEEIQIGRMATVQRRWARLDLPSISLSRHFCRDEMTDESSLESPLRHSQGFRLDNLKHFSSPIDGRIVNSWVKCSSNQKVGGEDGIGVENDINTRSQDAAATAFTLADAERFYPWAAKEMNHILKLYFGDA